MDRVSVVIPVYRTNEMAFRKCIESILSQTYPELEIIIVDDGNANHYQYIFEEIERSDPRIQVVHQKNAGVSAARNKGISIATGEYLSFVDSDDYLDCSFYSKMLKAMAGNEIVICGVSDSCYSTINARCDRRTFFSNPTIYSGVQYLNFSHNKLYQARIIKDNQLHFPVEVKLGEDALFVSSYLKSCGNIQIIPDLLYHYVYSPTSATNSYNKNFWEWEARVILTQWEMFHEYALSERETQGIHVWLFRKLRGAAYYYLKNETDHQEMNKYMKQIVSFVLFDELQYCDLSMNNRLLTRREKTVIRLWLALKEKGIKITYYLGKRRRKSHQSK